jgi:hypothetical protein
VHAASLHPHDNENCICCAPPRPTLPEGKRETSNCRCPRKEWMGGPSRKAGKKSRWTPRIRAAALESHSFILTCSSASCGKWGSGGPRDWLVMCGLPECKSTPYWSDAEAPWTRQWLDKILRTRKGNPEMLCRQIWRWLCRCGGMLVNFLLLSLAP